MTNNTTTCPRCDSENISENVTTDIPGDHTHKFGCDDCLHVWGGDADATDTIELEQDPADMDMDELYDALKA